MRQLKSSCATQSYIKKHPRTSLKLCKKPNKFTCKYITKRGSHCYLRKRRVKKTSKYYIRTKKGKKDYRRKYGSKYLSRYVCSKFLERKRK